MPYPDPKHFKTPMKRALSTGSAHTGAHEWLEGRLSGLILIPLAVWLFISFAMMARHGMDHAGAVAWIRKPYHSFPLILFLITFFHHASIGAKDVLIDYIYGHKRQLLGLLALRVYCSLLSLLGIFAVLYISFML